MITTELRNARAPELVVASRNAARSSTDGSPIPPPAEGDLSVCLRCGAVMKYDSADIAFRGMTQSEMDELKADTEQMNMLAKLVRGIRFVRQLREQRN